MSDRLTLQKAEFAAQARPRRSSRCCGCTRKEKQLKELQATVEKARSDMYAKQSTYELEKEKEEKLNAQIEKCKLYRPGRRPGGLRQRAEPLRRRRTRR